MATSTSETITLKLLVDKRNQKVLFAEAGSDFVDFLISLLSFPVGTVIRLLATTGGMPGSLVKLSHSLQNLNDNYMQQPDLKDFILKPKEPAHLPNNLGLLTNLDHPKTSLYRCSTKCPSRLSSRVNVSHDMKATCPDCFNRLDSYANYVPTVSAPIIKKEEGFVKGVCSYIVTDELKVKPNSTIGSFLMLEKLDVQIRELEVKTVEVGMDEGVKLLKESMKSTSVLTNVFLRGKEHEDEESSTMK